MRILHTSDWHLGKKLYKLDRTPEHLDFLNWLIDTLKSQKIDYLLIAGDVFDTPTPPHQSLEVFYEFLHRVSTETQTETLIIAGNHDSGLLLEAPSKLLAPHRIKVWGKLSDDAQDHWCMLEKGEEKLEVCSIPFFRSYELLPHGEGDALAALKKYLIKERTAPQLLMLHHLAGIFEAAGSEQVISLSGVDSIPVEILRSFDYVALGHIHKPQKIGEQIYYSGSPIPMRFSETHPKSVVLIDVEDGKISSELLKIPVSRKLLVIRATEEDYREKIKDLPAAEGMLPQVEVQLKLSSPVVGIIDELKKLIQDKGYELLSYQPTFSTETSELKRRENLFELSPVELFQEFFEAKFPDAPQMPTELREDFVKLLEKVTHASAPTQD
jgi:exonuclease SbcD